MAADLRQTVAERAQVSGRPPAPPTKNDQQHERFTQTQAQVVGVVVETQLAHLEAGIVEARSKQHDLAEELKHSAALVEARLAAGDARQHELATELARVEAQRVARCLEAQHSDDETRHPSTMGCAAAWSPRSAWSCRRASPTRTTLGPALAASTGGGHSDVDAVGCIGGVVPLGWELRESLTQKGAGSLVGAAQGRLDG